MKTQAHAHSILDADLGSGAPATVYLGFTTDIPTPTAAGTEAAGSGYARLAITNNNVNFPAAANNKKKLAVAFQTVYAAGGNIGKIYGVNIWDAAAAGARKRFLVLTDSYGFLATSLANDTLTAPGHNFAVNDEVLARVIPGAQVPAGMADWTKYFIKTAAGNDITLSATQGGATLDIGVGSIQLFRLRPKDWNDGDRLEIPANELEFQET